MIPLDRMVYLIYLIHPLVMYYYTARSRAVIYLGHVEQVYIYLATLIITICLAYFFNIAFEQPCRGMEIFIKKKWFKTRKNLPTTITPPLKTPEITITPATPIPADKYSSDL